MIATVHLVMGAVVGKTLKKSKYIVPVSFASHYFLDSIMHWQPAINLQKVNLTTFFVIGGDLLLASILFLIIVNSNKKLFFPIFLGSFFAVIPDIDLGFYFFLPFLIENPPLSYLWNLHVSIQRDTTFLLGLFPQLFIIFAGLYFLLRRR